MKNPHKLPAKASLEHVSQASPEDLRVGKGNGGGSNSDSHPKRSLKGTDPSEVPSHARKPTPSRLGGPEPLIQSDQHFYLAAGPHERDGARPDGGEVPGHNSEFSAGPLLPLLASGAPCRTWSFGHSWQIGCCITRTKIQMR